MLAYILAVLIGTGSVGLYIAAFFFPALHRKQDFIWSGVGCFYALTLWIYAHEVTGGILVGQIASVALISWFAWQILELRRQLIPVERQTPIPNPTQLQTAIAKQRANSVDIDVSQQHQQSVPLSKVIIEPTGENDNEAWIKLEVKTSPAKSPAPQPSQSITSQPPAETAKPRSSPPAPPAIAKPDLPAQQDRLSASKAEPSAQNHLNHPIDVTPVKNDPIDMKPIKSNLEDEANWES